MPIARHCSPSSGMLILLDEKHLEAALDLDILLFDDLVQNGPDLIVPHPRMHERRFVLEPLSRLRPDFILPGQTKTVSELLNLQG